MSVAEVDGATLRQALGQFPTGVALVTTRGADGQPVGLTINSLAALSLQPPLVLWSLMNRSANRPVFDACSHFAVHVLGAHQTELARRFADPRVADRFAGLAWAPGLGGAPLLADALVHLQCALHRCDEGGDHTLYIGRVLAVQQQAQGDPAVYWRGQFASVAA